MAKKRVTTLLTSDAIDREHPEGGTFGVIPMGFDDAIAYAELATKEDFVRDGREILRDGHGRPIRESAFSVADSMEFAKKRLRYIKDHEVDGVDVHLLRKDGDEWVFVDGEGNEQPTIQIRGKKVAPLSLVHQFLTDMGTADVKLEVAVDADGNEITDSSKQTKAGTKDVMKPVKENIFLWVTRESAILADELKKVAQGNSSTAPSGSSVPSSAATTT